MEIAETIEVGNTYECQAVGIEQTVVGVVEQLYGKTVLIHVVHCNPSDQEAVSELQNRLLVKYENILACNENNKMESLSI